MQKVKSIFRHCEEMAQHKKERSSKERFSCKQIYELKILFANITLVYVNLFMIASN